MKKINRKIIGGILIMCCLGLTFGCSSGDSGSAGSMSRFTIVDDTMYSIVGMSDLQILDISEPALPKPTSRMAIDWGIETLFASGDKLFVGANTGVYILDIDIRQSPVYLSKFDHADACDPVVVAGDYAYVTLRSENVVCNNASNQLDIVNVSDPENPSLSNTILMQNPKGLGVDQDVLFVCDGIAGLKIFNIIDPEQPQLIDTEFGIDCYDIILKDNVLIVSDVNGIIQFDYSSLPLRQLSKLDILE